jgi:hypothetical protein
MVVAQDGFSSMNQARCTVSGRFVTVEDEADKAAAREEYLKRHPEAFWVDFGDFSFMQMREIVSVGYIGGFGRISKVRRLSVNECWSRICWSTACSECTNFSRVQDSDCALCTGTLCPCACT